MCCKLVVVVVQIGTSRLRNWSRNHYRHRDPTARTPMLHSTLPIDNLQHWRAMPMILKVFLQDENGAKSTATAEGGPEEMERKVEEFRKLFTKHHMSIVDYKILSNDGSEGTLA